MNQSKVGCDEVPRLCIDLLSEGDTGAAHELARLPQCRRRRGSQVRNIGIKTEPPVKETWRELCMHRPLRIGCLSARGIATTTQTKIYLIAKRRGKGYVKRARRTLPTRVSLPLIFGLKPPSKEKCTLSISSIS